MGDNNAEKIKMLQQKLLERTHEFNKLDRTYTSQKVSQSPSSPCISRWTTTLLTQACVPQRVLENAQRDRDIALADLNRVNAKTKKLEALCKELQKQNKAVIEESKLATEQEQVRTRAASYPPKRRIDAKSMQGFTALLRSTWKQICPCHVFETRQRHPS